MNKYEGFEFRTTIHNWLKEDKIKEAINLLLETLEEEKGEAVQQSAMFYRVQNGFRQGLISWEEAYRFKNQIVKSIFELVEMVVNTNFIHLDDRSFVHQLNQLMGTLWQTLPGIDADNPKG